jgi:hypothetical protein
MKGRGECTLLIRFPWGTYWELTLGDKVSLGNEVGYPLRRREDHMVGSSLCGMGLRLSLFGVDCTRVFQD